MHLTVVSHFNFLAIFFKNLGTPVHRERLLLTDEKLIENLTGSFLREVVLVLPSIPGAPGKINLLDPAKSNKVETCGDNNSVLL